MRHRVIHLHPQAPLKPAPSQPCNGCGVCCAAEPCPMGMLLSRKRQGACRALTWHEAESTYRCGVLSDPQRWLPALPAPALGWVQALARRWIAAGLGCDSDLLPSPPHPGPAADRNLA